MTCSCATSESSATQPYSLPRRHCWPSFSTGHRRFSPRISLRDLAGGSTVLIRLRADLAGFSSPGPWPGSSKAMLSGLLGQRWRRPRTRQSGALKQALSWLVHRPAKSEPIRHAHSSSTAVANHRTTRSTLAWMGGCDRILMAKDLVNRNQTGALPGSSAAGACLCPCGPTLGRQGLWPLAGVPTGAAP